MTRDEAFEKFWNTEIVSSVTGKVDVPMWGDIDRNDTAYIFMAGYNACKEALEQPEDYLYVYKGSEMWLKDSLDIPSAGFLIGKIRLEK